MRGERKDYTENHEDEKENHREIKNTLTITVWLYRLGVSLVHFILGMIGRWAIFLMQPLDCSMDYFNCTLFKVGLKRK